MPITNPEQAARDNAVIRNQLAWTGAVLGGGALGAAGGELAVHHYHPTEMQTREELGIMITYTRDLNPANLDRVAKAERIAEIREQKMPVDMVHEEFVFGGVGVGVALAVIAMGTRRLLQRKRQPTT